MTAGVVALMLQMDPKLTAAQITGILRRTAQPLPGTDFNWQDDYDYAEPVTLPAEVRPLPFVSKTTRAAFEATVRKAKEYITAGDIIQVVLSHRFARPTTAEPFVLYRTLRTTNPIENLNGSIARYTRNVKQWRDGAMVLRWVARLKYIVAIPEWFFNI